MAVVPFKGFVGQSYTLRNNRFDCQRTLNMYPEVDETGLGANSSISQLTRTPGLTKLVDAIGEEGRALYVTSTNVLAYLTSGGIYTVTGSNDATGWSVTRLTSLGIPPGAMITDNGVDAFIVAGGTGWSVNLSTGVVTSITTVTPTSVTYLDGYVIVTASNSNKFYWTDLYSTTFPALNFASAEANPDQVVAVFNNNEDLWVFGKKTTELWYDSGPVNGSVNTVFSRRPGILVETGCASATSVAKLDRNRIMWLSVDDRGGPIAVMAEGYTPQRVSTFAIEKEWATLTAGQISKATSYAYKQDGHLFYVLNIPGLSSTWVYDVTTSDQLQQPTWHERTWTDPDTGIQSRHLAEGHAMYYNKHVVADYQTGELYFYDQDGYSDDGAVITRQRVTPHISNNGIRMFYNRLQIDFKTGAGDFVTTEPLIQLEYSNDGGNTWSSIITKPVGAIGSYITRVVFHQLGQSRDRVFRVTMTDPVDWAVSSASLDIEAGAY